MEAMRFHFSQSFEGIEYDGTQLAPRWLYRTFPELRGAALGVMAAWVGPANVTTDHMVDLEDVVKSDRIWSPRMLHFVAEWFDCTLSEGVWRQRLFVSQIASYFGQEVSRRGDDVIAHLGPQCLPHKMSVSIVTASADSVLMHLGLNVDVDERIPVRACGLSQFGVVHPEHFARAAAEDFCAEFDDIIDARTKVRPL